MRQAPCAYHVREFVAAKGKGRRGAVEICTPDLQNCCFRNTSFRESSLQMPETQQSQQRARRPGKHVTVHAWGLGWGNAAVGGKQGA